jgi:hypothetical protein
MLEENEMQGDVAVRARDNAKVDRRAEDIGEAPFVNAKNWIGLDFVVRLNVRHELVGD